MGTGQGGSPSMASRRPIPMRRDQSYSDPVEILRELYSLSGCLNEVANAMPAGPARTALAAIVEGGLPETMHVAERLVTAGGEEVDAEVLARSLKRGAEVVAKLIAEEAPRESSPPLELVEEARDICRAWADRNEDASVAAARLTEYVDAVRGGPAS